MKKILSIVLAFCIIFATMTAVFAVEKKENIKYSAGAFGKYAYYDYGKNGSVDSFVIVNNNSYSDYNKAEDDALSKVDIINEENHLQTIRYQKENSQWFPVEKTVYSNKNEVNTLTHFRNDGKSFYCDYEKNQTYNNEKKLESNETIRYKGNVRESYLIEYEYDSNGNAISESHYINGTLNYIEEYSSYNLPDIAVENDAFDYTGEITKDTIQTKSTNSYNITIYKYDISIFHNLPFGHLDFSMDGTTYSYGTNTSSISNYFRKLIHSEPGYLFSSATSYWTSAEPFNHYTTAVISLNEDELVALASSIVLITLLCTQFDSAASTADVTKHKFISGAYQYYDYTSANCSTFLLDLIYGIIPDRIDNAGRSLWGSSYNLSGIFTVNKAFKLLKEV